MRKKRQEGIVGFSAATTCSCTTGNIITGTTIQVE